MPILTSYPLLRKRLSQHLYRMPDGQRLTKDSQVRLNLGHAANIARDHSIGARGQNVARLAFANLMG